MAVRYLKEAYSEGFPSWLTKTIDKNKDIKDKLNKYNIDLANAEFVPGQLSGSRDPALKDASKVNVFRLMDGSVYLDGINNPYVYLPRMGIASNTSKLSWKKILEIATDYGYIKRNDPDLIQKRSDRKDAKSGSIERGKGQYHQQDFDYDWDSLKSIPKGWKWVQARGQDKSGYPLNPNKYKDMLDNVGLDNYSDRLQKYYDKIENYRSQITNIVNSATLDKATAKGQPSGWGSMFDSISDCIRSLDSCIGNYNRIRDEIDEIIKRGDIDESYPIDKKIGNMFKFYGSSLRRDLDDLKERIATANSKIN